MRHRVAEYRVSPLSHRFRPSVGFSVERRHIPTRQDKMTMSGLSEKGKRADGILDEFRTPGIRRNPQVENRAG